MTAPSRARVEAHRKRLRGEGLRPVRVWLPGTRTEAFREEARRQSEAIAKSPFEPADQAFVDAVSDLPAT